MEKGIPNDLLVTLYACLHMKPFPLLYVLLYLNFEHWCKHLNWLNPYRPLLPLYWDEGFRVTKGLRGLTPKIFLFLNAQDHIGNFGVVSAVTKHSLPFMNCCIFRLWKWCLWLSPCRMGRQFQILKFQTVKKVVFHNLLLCSTLYEIGMWLRSSISDSWR